MNHRLSQIQNPNESILNLIQLDQYGKPSNTKVKDMYQELEKKNNSFTNNSLICTMKRQRVQHRRMIHSISQTAPKSLKSINRSDGASRWVVDEGWNCVLGQNPMKDSAVAGRKKVKCRSLSKVLFLGCLLMKWKSCTAVKLCERFYIAVTINKIIQEWRMALVEVWIFLLWTFSVCCWKNILAHIFCFFFSVTAATRNTSIPSLINIHVGSHERQ